VGHRPAARGPGGDHHVPAAHRHQIHPLRQPARLLAAGRRSRLIAYAHSIDFGAKGYDNLAGLAALQRHAAGQLRRPAGRLIMMVKPAHAYKTERSYVLS
jgi:hypothetical protein